MIYYLLVTVLFYLVVSFVEWDFKWFLDLRDCQETRLVMVAVLTPIYFVTWAVQQ